MARKKPSYIDFDHSQFQAQLKKYSLVGEVGVLSYKYSKVIVKLWRFKTPEIAQLSAQQIYDVFYTILKYLYPMSIDSRQFELLSKLICAENFYSWVTLEVSDMLDIVQDKSGAKINLVGMNCH